MFRFLLYFKKVEPHIFKAVLSEFFVQLINAAIFLILLIYMEKVGYKDSQSADYISYRFLGVLLFAFPLGLMIKGRKLLPYFKIAAYSVPLLSWLIIEAVDHHLHLLLYASMFFWGISFTFIQITILPFILRNAKRETHTESISLKFANRSLSMILAGVIIFTLRQINPELFDDEAVLKVIAVLGLASIFFVHSIKIKESVPERNINRFNLRNFDWPIIIKALIPTLIIATGAGLTIPFMGIFFFNVHGLDSDQFSLLGAATSVLVAAGSFTVPAIKNALGFRKAIPTTQSLAVIILFLLASTQLFRDYDYILYIAIMLYIMRQPLMALAGPMTSEVVMNYVGQRNQEIMSALISATWSGSWFISSRIFKFLREEGLPYYQVFYITAFLYAVGVVWYYYLVLDYENKVKKGELPE